MCPSYPRGIKWHLAHFTRGKKRLYFQMSPNGRAVTSVNTRLTLPDDLCQAAGVVK